MYPARTSSLWLGSSASAGSSRRVRRNRVDMRRAGVDTGSPLVGALQARAGSTGQREDIGTRLTPSRQFPPGLHQDGGEAPDLREPDSRVGGPRRGVEVID